MPKFLTEKQIDRFKKQGAVAPIRLLESHEALKIRQKFEDLEEEIGDKAQNRFRVKGHLPFPWLTELAKNPALLDATEDLIGPDIILWGPSFFTKKANDKRFVSCI